MSTRIASRSVRRPVLRYRHLGDQRKRGAPRAVRFWGREYVVAPAIHPYRYGDGGAWLSLWPMNQRPNHYLVRVDSSWLHDDTDGDEFRDLVDAIVEDLSLEFGECGYDKECEDGTCDCEWPVGSWDVGCSWSVWGESRSPWKRRRQKVARKHRRKRAHKRGWRPGR